MSTFLPRGARAPRLFRSLLAATSAIAVVGAALVPLSAQAAPSALAAAADPTDYTSFVDPFMSTEGDHGQNIPGAEVPHGLAKPNPMTAPGRSHSGYDYAQTSIKGFTLTNLDGVGGSGAGGDLLVVPTYNTYTSRPSADTYALPFDHDDETAKPGYYQVGLQAAQGTINAELTATVRSGLERFTFPEAGNASIVLDLQNNFTGRTASDLAVTILDDGRAEISGSVSAGFNGYNYKLYYDSVTSVPVTGVTTWGDGSTLTTTPKRSGVDTGAVISFDVTDGEAVQLTTTLSPISVAQARTDQAAELTGKTFDQVKQDAHDEWQDTLSQVAVTSDATSDPDGSTEGIFYTSLYRMLATPTNATSTDGTYRGVDGKVHHADGYIHYDGWGTWDDFRKYSVLAYLYPGVYDDVVQSLVDLYANDASAGNVALSSLVQSVPSVRFERSAIVIADAVSKGVHLDRLAQAYPAIVSNANTYNAANQALGYIADDPGTTVASSYDDYALSVIATSLGKTADAAADVTRSANYKNVIKPNAWTAEDGTQVGVLSSRNSAGTFASDSLEQFQAAKLYQGTLWQFNWYPAQDMAGLISAMGGTAATEQALSHYFGEQAPDDGTKMLKSNANEVDLQTPYLFNYLGEPSKTQKWVRDLYTKETWQNYIATGQTDGNNPPSSNGQLTPPIKEKVFTLAPDGFLPTMDDDTGAMSATFVAAAVGLYPVTAGSSQYQVGSPFFPRVDISHEDGTRFSVTADGVSPDDYYIQSATLDGKSYDNTWVDYSDMVGNGSFDTTMGSTASTWGTKSAPAFSLSTATSTAPAATVTNDSATLTADAAGKVDGHITMTLAGATFSGSNGVELVGAGLATVVGLPEGVAATVTRTGSTTLDVHVAGTLPSSAKVKFAVQLADGALTGVTADQVTGTGLTTRDPFTILVTNHWRSELQDAYDESRLVIQGNYAGATYDVLVTARDTAKTVLANASATDEQLQDAQSNLDAATNGLALSGGGLRRLEGEQSDSWSGGSDLHNEASNLGGVRPKSWVAFNGISFSDGETPSSVQVRYSGASDDGYANAAVEVHVGSVDGPLVATVKTPPTASNFGTYATATADLSNVAALTSAGSKTVYFVFTGSASDGSQHWVGNFDWMQFVDGSAATEQPLLSAGNATALASGINKTDPNLIQNIKNSDWAEYDGYDFGSGADTVSVRYDKPNSRTSAGTSVEIHLDTKDSKAVATVPLTTTGDTWGTYNTITAALPSVVTGTHNVYLVFLAPAATDALPYVANVSYAQFSLSEANRDGKSLAAAARTDWGGNSATGGNTMKTETSTWSDGTTVTDVANTHEGDWLHFAKVDFAQAATSLSIHYVNNSSRCGTNSSIDVYLDSMTGTKIVNVPLPVTGSAWANAGTTAVTLPTTITGTHDVYFVMHTTADANHPYVANFDSFTFNYGVDKTSLSALYAANKPLLADADRYVDVDFRTFDAAMDAAAGVLATDTAVASDVRAATRALTLAAGQLDTRARRGLMVAVTDASAIDLSGYTKETASAVKAELAAAQAAVTADAATDDEYSAQTTRLEAAVDALEVAPTDPGSPTNPQPVTVPQAPSAISAVADGRSLTVSWAAPVDDGGSAITGYTVQLEGADPVTVGATATSYTFSGLARGHEYRASVVASNAVGNSTSALYTAYVPIAALAPEAPGLVGVATVGSSVTVTWTAPDDNGSPLTSYLVRIGDGDPVRVAATDSSYTFTGVAAGSYKAAVAASNAIGTSDFTTSAASVTIDAPLTVTSASASAPSWSQVQVRWTTTGGTRHTVLHLTLSKGSQAIASQDVWSDAGKAVFSKLSGASKYHVTVGVLGGTASVGADVKTPAQPKVHSHAVKITGKALVGKTLGVELHSKSWTASTHFRYVWMANGKKVGTGSHLKVTSKIVGKRITVRVTGVRTKWKSASVTSSAVRIKR